jgi:hypothetical protein
VMPVLMSDRKVTHKHFCPFCEREHDCFDDFCAHLNPLMCDACWNNPPKLEDTASPLGLRSESCQESTSTN